MAGPAFYSGTMNIAKNEDWIVPLVYTVDYTVSGDPPNIQPLDLAGSGFELQIRKTEEDATALVSVDTDVANGGIEITNPAGGEFTVMISRERLKRLHPGEYRADLVRILPDGTRERLWEGNAIVVTGASR